MTNLNLIYLIGGPGTGKTTLMARLTATYTRLPVDRPVPHDLLINPATGAADALEIGRQRPTFSGTDALPSAIIETAVPWINTRPAHLILAEGARLANVRFLTAAAAAGYRITLAHLTHPDADHWRTRRAQQLGKHQNPSWVAGRITASRNLANNPPPSTTVYTGHPDTLAAPLAAILNTP